MLKNVITFMLTRFQDTDTRKQFLGCLKIHVVVWYVYFLVLELVLITVLAAVYTLAVRELSWLTTLSIGILVLLFSTLFLGIYAIYVEKARFFRWFSLRTKLVYYLMFIWALVNYFADPNIVNLLVSAAWALGATIFVLEDFAIIRTLDFVRYRYRGVDNKDDV